MQGITFKSDMIQAIVKGIKTHTRRAEASLKEINKEPNAWICENYHFKVVKPRYRVGTILYIKEAWYIAAWTRGEVADIMYRDDSMHFGVSCNDWLEREWNNPKWDRWHSPRFMPEWAARYFVEILSVDYKRLQDMTEEDAKAEGFTTMPGLTAGGNIGLMSALMCFKNKWDSINPKYPWSLNPWVTDYGFKLLEVKP